MTAAPRVSRSGNRVSLSSETVGANLGYQLLEEGQAEGRAWQVYQEEPVELEPGQRLVAIAHRLGFKPSETVTVSLSLRQ